MKKVFNWIGKRAKEPSTYTGLAIIAGVAGFPGAAVALGKIGAAAGLILGGGLIAHQSSPVEDALGAVIGKR